MNEKEKELNSIILNETKTEFEYEDKRAELLDNKAQICFGLIIGISIAMFSIIKDSVKTNLRANLNWLIIVLIVVMALSIIIFTCIFLTKKYEIPSGDEISNSCSNANSIEDYNEPLISLYKKYNDKNSKLNNYKAYLVNKLLICYVSICVIAIVIFGYYIFCV